MTLGLMLAASTQALSEAEAGGLVFLNTGAFNVATSVTNGQLYTNDLIFFNNNIYAGMGANGNLFAYEGNEGGEPNLLAFSAGSFTEAADIVVNQVAVLGMVVFSDGLYSVGGNTGSLLTLTGVTATRPSLLEFTGSGFTEVGVVTSNQVAVNGMVELSSKLYGVTGNSGSLLEYT